jgi:hypothetical protein
MGDFFWPALFGVFFVCWCLGAYNRLRRLRRQALNSVQKLIAQLAEFRPLFDRRAQSQKEPLEPERRQGLAASGDAGWSALTAAAGQLDAALQSASHTTLDSAAIRNTSQAFEALQRSWSAASEAPLDLAGEALPPELLTQWGVLSHRMLAARAAANQDLAAYNQALAQVPVRWLAPVIPFAAVAYF